MYISKLKQIYIIYSEQRICDDIMLDIVRKVFIDSPTQYQKAYNFKTSSPFLDGQIGVPPIVDKILGSM